MGRSSRPASWHFARDSRAGRFTQHSQHAHLPGRHAAGPAPLARSTAHAGDVRAGIAHKPQVIQLQSARDRREQPGLVRLRHPRGERTRREKVAHTGPILIGGIEKHARGARGRRSLYQSAGRRACDAVGIGIGHGDHAAAAVAAGCGAAHRRHEQRRHPLGAGNPREANLDQHRARGGKRAGGALDGALVSGVAQGGGHRPRPIGCRVDLTEYRDRHGAQGPCGRVLGIDDVGAAGKRRHGLLTVCHAYKEPHRRDLVIAMVAPRRGYYDLP